MRPCTAAGAPGVRAQCTSASPPDPHRREHSLALRAVSFVIMGPQGLGRRGKRVW